MKTGAALVLAIILILGSAGVLHATVIDFETVPGTGSKAKSKKIPSGYEGFSWTYFWVIHEDFFPGTGYEHGVTSGQWAAYNAWDFTAFISDDLFDFTGAYFTSAWDSSNILNISGLDNGSEIYRSEITLNNQTPVWFQANWTGVDELQFSTVGFQFVMDDFTVNENAPIPEPATILLLGTGFAGLAAFRKKFTDSPS